MPDGKLATICTLVMIFSCVISIMLFIDDGVEDDIIKRVKAGKSLARAFEFQLAADGYHVISEKGEDISENAIKRQIDKWFKPCMVDVPVVCSLIQAASLYIFMNAKVSGINCTASLKVPLAKIRRSAKLQDVCYRWCVINCVDDDTFYIVEESV